MKVFNRFDSKAQIYDKSRPNYPISAVKLLGLEPGMIAADIGAGTGKLTEMLLDTGCRVAAIEPNADMRGVLSDKLFERPLLTITDATAEMTNLPDHSVDVITVAQAFHWFDHKACQAEFARILKPSGRVALMWNNRNYEREFMRKHIDLMKEHRTNSVVSLQDEQEVFRRFFQNYEIREFEYAQRLEKDVFIDLTFSRSYSPKLGDSEYEPLKLSAERLFEEYQKDGYVEYFYKTEVVLGTF